MAEVLLKSLTLPGLSDRYIIADSSLSVSGAAADAKTVGTTISALPTIHHGTSEPSSGLGKNGDIYIKHS